MKNKEKLLSVKEIFDVSIETCFFFETDDKQEKRFDGYAIETTGNQYLVLIENGQQCCENFGYFASEDNTSDFIGKSIESFSFVDTELDTSSFSCGDRVEYKKNIQFFDLRFTDGSVLQFAVYNAHNGYYGHDILIMKNAAILMNTTI